jgi:hypothetical protein
MLKQHPDFYVANLTEEEHQLLVQDNRTSYPLVVKVS